MFDAASKRPTSDPRMRELSPDQQLHEQISSQCPQENRKPRVLDLTRPEAFHTAAEPNERYAAWNCQLLKETWTPSLWLSNPSAQGPPQGCIAKDFQASNVEHLHQTQS